MIGIPLEGTTTPLAANAVWQSGAQQVFPEDPTSPNADKGVGASVLVGTIEADQACTLAFLGSDDNVAANFREVYPPSIAVGIAPAGEVSQNFFIIWAMRYMMVQITNGPIAQTVLKFQGVWIS